MEETNTRTGDGRRLVLGFDAGCATCSGLARSIEEAVGDKLEIRSLNDPIVEHWRNQALSENAPWAPTLFEVGSDSIKAWTGRRMGLVLAGKLGIFATWRVMQTLGEVRDKSTAADIRQKTGAGALSRGQFMKALGGGALAFGALTGGTALSTSAASAQSIRPVKSSVLEGVELDRIVGVVAKRKDVVNVMGSSTAQSFSQKTERSAYGQRGAQGADSPLEVRAAQHELAGGNELTAVSFLRDGKLTVYHEYVEPANGVLTEALELRVDGNRVLVERSSTNGAMDSASSTAGTAATRAGCTGCGGGGPGSYRTFRKRRCVDYNYRCLLGACGGCASAILSGPAAVLACLAVNCAALGPFVCCDRMGYRCVRCLSGQ